jgi:malonyl-CoA O-methyltransferase
MSEQRNYAVDVKSAKRRFSNAALSYDEHAVVQRLVANNLLETLDIIKIKPQRVLDLGAGTGDAARLLARRYPRSTITLLDIALPMLTHARSKAPRWRSRQHYVCAYAQLLPLADDSIDLIFANLVFHWCNDLDSVFNECNRVLKPGGLILFSSLGPDTLRELRDAWSGVDAAPHVHMFIDMHDVGDALIRASFTGPILECDKITVHYDDVNALIRDIRGLGAGNSLQGRMRTLGSPRVFKRMVEQYEIHRSGQKLPATIEVVYAHAWCAEQGARLQDGSTVATFPFSEIKRR